MQATFGAWRLRRLSRFRSGRKKIHLSREKDRSLRWISGCSVEHELLEKIWGFAFQEYEHTVTSHINRLRIKIEPNLNKPEYILTAWGAGYRFAE